MSIELLSVDEQDTLQARLYSVYMLSGMHTTMTVRALNDELESRSLRAEPKIDMTDAEIRAARDKILEQRQLLVDLIDEVSNKYKLDRYPKMPVSKSAVFADQLAREVKWLSKYA